MQPVVMCGNVEGRSASGWGYLGGSVELPQGPVDEAEQGHVEGGVIHRQRLQLLSKEGQHLQGPH